MVLYPKAGATGRALLDAVTSVGNSVRNAGSGGNSVENYLEWAADAERTCRMVMRRPDLERLVLTPRYWATHQNPARTRASLRAISDEVSARGNDLDAARHELDQVLRHWADPLQRVVVVPDTNLLLHHEHEIDAIDWHEVIAATVHQKIDVRLAIPLLVVDELDNAKRDKVRSRARTTLKKLWDWFEAHRSGPAAVRHLLAPRTEERGEVTVELLLDGLGHARLPRPDDELVDRAASLAALIDDRVHFATYDTGAALRAQSVGLPTHRLQSVAPPRT